jgi:hypothetical protein
MKRFGMVLGAVVLMGLSCSASVAQSADPSYKADPDTYKVILSDANFRVIEANHKKGVHDKVHGHPREAASALDEAEAQQRRANRARMGKVVARERDTLHPSHWGPGTRR